MRRKVLTFQMAAIVAVTMAAAPASAGVEPCPDPDACEPPPCDNPAICPDPPGGGKGGSKGKDRDKKVEKRKCSKIEKPAHRHKRHVRR